MAALSSNGPVRVWIGTPPVAFNCRCVVSISEHGWLNGTSLTSMLAYMDLPLGQLVVILNGLRSICGYANWGPISTRKNYTDQELGTWCDPTFMSYVPMVNRCAVVREILGNPFKPRCKCDPDVGAVCEWHDVVKSWSEWKDGTVRKIANTIIADNDFSSMPILADALEDAGCEDAEVIQHCRGMEVCPACLGRSKGYCTEGSIPICKDGWSPKRSPCMRGCWVLNFLLGR